MDWNSLSTTNLILIQEALSPVINSLALKKIRALIGAMLLKPSFPRVLRITKRKNEWGEVFEGLFDKTKDTDKYRNRGENTEFSKPIPGYGGQLLENLSALYPQQHASKFIPGETSQGFGGIIGTVAGAALGSIIPGVGTALGAKVGGGIGSMF
jgi:hypothetical protein